MRFATHQNLLLHFATIHFLSTCLSRTTLDVINLTDFPTALKACGPFNVELCCVSLFARGPSMLGGAQSRLSFETRPYMFQPTLKGPRASTTHNTMENATLNGRSVTMIFQNLLQVNIVEGCSPGPRRNQATPSADLFCTCGSLVKTLCGPHAPPVHRRMQSLGAPRRM